MTIPRPRIGARDVAIMLVLAAAYFLFGKFGLKLAFVQSNATAVWLPTGLALAAILL
jgi:integral membrane sensor domain MASE1